ncbi:Nitrile hydratase [Pseudomonas syringae pv. aceris]|nr:Nitrile hydratase [Pseudomonas syringae pv. aceris]
MLARVLAKLEAQGILNEALLQERMAVADSGTPRNGALMVARAWLDEDYKALLLRDGRAAAEAIGVHVPWAPPLGVLENTDHVHYLLVCTLCSCYPRWLLGYPRDWYKSSTYRARAVREPRALLAEWGQRIADSTVVRVVDSTADYRWMVLPQRPAGTDGWTLEQLADIVTADALVGADALHEAALRKPSA